VVILILPTLILSGVTIGGLVLAMLSRLSETGDGPTAPVVLSTPLASVAWVSGAVSALLTAYQTVGYLTIYAEQRVRELPITAATLLNDLTARVAR